MERVTVMPVAAVTGDNIVDRGDRTCPWYDGPTVLEFLETVEVPDPARHAALRFPIQYVLRPHTKEFHDYRGYAGTVAAGTVRVGEEVTVLPLGDATRIAAIDRYREPLRDRGKRRSRLGSARGRTRRWARPHDRLRWRIRHRSATRFTADHLLDERGGRCARASSSGSNTRHAACAASSNRIEDRLDVPTLERVPNPTASALTTSAAYTVRTMEPVFVDPYVVSRDTGSFILIDPATRHTVAGGMVREVLTEDPSRTATRTGCGVGLEDLSTRMPL